MQLCNIVSRLDPADSVTIGTGAPTHISYGHSSASRHTMNASDLAKMSAFSVFRSQFVKTPKWKYDIFFYHWLHCKLSLWQLPVQPVMKISSKWRHFLFSKPHLVSIQIEVIDDVGGVGQGGHPGTVVTHIDAIDNQLGQLDGESVFFLHATGHVKDETEVPLSSTTWRKRSSLPKVIIPKGRHCQRSSFPKVILFNPDV